MTETPAEAFDRGVTAGELREWRGQTDRHFEKINGSQETTAKELTRIRKEHSEDMANIKMKLQSLTDAFVASGATEVAKASALKTERDDKAGELRSQSELAARGFAPTARVITFLGGILTFLLIIGWIISQRGGK